MYDFCLDGSPDISGSSGKTSIHIIGGTLVKTLRKGFWEGNPFPPRIERNYESDLSSFVAVQLLDFSGFFCHLYWFLRRIYVGVWFGSWKVLEAKRVVICIGLWGLEDLCLDVCSVFCGCFSEVLLRRERLPFASQSVRLQLVRHDADMSQTQCDWLYSGLSP